MSFRSRSWVGCVALVAALAGCGGGSSSSSGSETPPPTAAQGSLSIGLTGGVPTGYQHVWVTASAIALNADADRAWSAGDSTWKVIRFDAPKTIDLSASINGVLSRIVTGQPIDAGIYAQMRMFLVRHDDALTDSAKTLKLSYNDQVDYLDAAGTARQVPLELYDTALGMRVAGTFNVSSTVSTDLTMQLDIAKNLVRIASDDGVDRFTTRPQLRVYDIALTGAIIGIMDKSVFCAAGTTTGCVYDVVATAQRPSDDGTAMVSVRASPVVIGDTYAAFALYPLPVLPSGAGFDVVIRGRNMRTMIVRAVPATADALLAANPTQLGVDVTDPAHPVAAPLVPQLSTRGDSNVTLASATVPSTSQIRFGQTLPGTGELPHEIVSVNTDPFSGLFARATVLPSGPLRVTTYSTGGPLAFSDVTPQEGLDHFTATTIGTRYDFERSGIVSAPGGTNVGVTATDTSRKAGMAPAAVTINVTDRPRSTTRRNW